MKFCKVFLTLYIIHYTLYIASAQQKPFSFWSYIQAVVVRPDAPTITATGGYLDATISLSNDGDTFLFYKGTDTTALTLIASIETTTFVDTPLTAGTYTYYSKKIVDGDTSYYSASDTALVLALIELSDFTQYTFEEEFIADANDRQFNTDPSNWEGVIGTWRIRDAVLECNLFDGSNAECKLLDDYMNLFTVTNQQLVINFDAEYNTSFGNQLNITVDIDGNYFESTTIGLGLTEDVELIFDNFTGSVTKDLQFSLTTSDAEPLLKLDNLSLTRRSTDIWGTSLASLPLNVFYNSTKLTYGVYAALDSNEWGYDSGTLYINVGEDPINGTVGYEL